MSGWCSSWARSAGSDGARTANGHRLAAGCRYLVNGEPTDGRLASATRGILRVKLSAKGRAAHSSRPDLGESAIDKLLDALVRLRAQVLPDDPVLGRTHYTIGLISGGIAPNVVSPHAEAEVMFRTVGPLADLEPALAAIRDLVHTTPVLEVPAVQLTTLDGFEVASFPFTTDIPFLDRWGQPLLVGPGSVLLAHTDAEHVGIGELTQAVDTYEALARRLLGESERDDDRHVDDGSAAAREGRAGACRLFLSARRLPVCGQAAAGPAQPVRPGVDPDPLQRGPERDHRPGRQRGRRARRGRGAAAGQRRHGAPAVQLSEARTAG